jgi:hypothetical protein
MNYVKQTLQPHGRIAIRNKVKLLLRAATALGEKWFCSRPNEIWLEECPCGLIYFTEERAATENSAPRYYNRTLTLLTEILQYEDTERENSIDDYLDSRAYEVEAVLMMDKQLGLKDLVSDCRLLQTQAIGVPDPSGEKSIAAVRLTWEIDYTMNDYGVVSLDEFLRFNDKTNSVAPDGANIESSTVIRVA